MQNIKKYLYKKETFNIIDAIYIFLLAGVLGWLIEIGYVYTITGKIVDRGMCYGPICTIYGIGALILYSIFGNLEKKKSNIIIVFLSSSLILGTFEVISGLFLKFVLNLEMWNYDGQFLEILNYTTVPITLGWGLIACFYIFFIQPLMFKIIRFTPKTISKRLALILISLYFLDYSLSLYTVINNPEILYDLVNP